MVMMMNLFSIFDPSGVFFSNWMSLLFLLWVLCLNMKFFLFSNKIIKMAMFLLKKEMKSIYLNKSFNYFLILSTFFMLMILNLLSLWPYVFTPTAHLLFSFVISLSFWVGIMTFSFLKNFKSTVSHFVPLGTPLPLMNLMVLIELISNIIRPLTLAVRLSANMMAGHLLLSIIGMFLLPLNSFSFLTFFLPFVLTTLESAVSIIQGYVFSMLVVLYISENS